MPMHVGALHIFELPANGFRGRFANRLRTHLAERLPLTPVLRRRLWMMPLNMANPAWVDAEPDLKQHVVEHRLPARRAGRGKGSTATAPPWKRLWAACTRSCWTASARCGSST
jgi:diacylglycerol O-acyltransferase